MVWASPCAARMLWIITRRCGSVPSKWKTSPERCKDARIFIHHDLSIDASPVGDTAYFDPELQGVVHYKDQRWFLVAGEDPLRYGVEHFTTGTKRIGDAEGTWRDAEDGHLSRNPIAGLGGFHGWLSFARPGRRRGPHTVWLACGDSREALVDLHDKIALKTARRMMDRTEAYWRALGPQRAHRFLSVA